MDSDERRSLAPLAQILLIIGLLGLGGLLAARAEGLPESWRFPLLRHSATGLLISLGLVGTGIALLWRESHRPPNWSPTAPGRRFQQIVVYSRQDCPLCEEAIELLMRYRKWLPPPVEVDIDEHDDLRAQFNESVPVVEVDGRIRFRGVVSEALLRRLIEGTPPELPLRQR